MEPSVNSHRPIRLLLVEDSLDDEALLLLHFARAGVAIEHRRVATEAALREELARPGWHLVISDFDLPRFNGLRALEVVQASGLDLPFIMVSGTVSEEAAVVVLKAGAHDFVSKGKFARLIPAMNREMREAERRADQRKAHEQLVVSDRMASVGMLAAGVAHEINNPLAAVIGNLAIARELTDTLGSEDAQALADARAAIADAATAADRVRDIVRDVKMFSRSADDRLSAVSVHRVIDSTIRMVWNDARHRARIIKKYDSVRPVMATESRLGQVFLNLVMNAMEALPTGHSDTNVIQIATRVDGSFVVIEVSDTGPGMSREVLKNLFTPFFTTKPAGQGTGLGLSICRKLVMGMGGEISVVSEPSKGTTFTVRLPVAEAAAAQPTGTSGTDHPALTTGRRARVLVIDDESLITEMVRRVLGRYHDVAVSFSAPQALARLAAGERYDAILCDVLMPEMTGTQLVAELARAIPDQADRVVLMSGGTSPEARAWAEMNPNRFIEKPFEPAELITLAARWGDDRS